MASYQTCSEPVLIIAINNILTAHGVQQQANSRKHSKNLYRLLRVSKVTMKAYILFTGQSYTCLLRNNSNKFNEKYSQGNVYLLFSPLWCASTITGVQLP